MTENVATNRCEKRRRKANYRHHTDTGLGEMRNNRNPMEDNTCTGQDYNRTPPKYESVRCTHSRVFGGVLSTLMSQYFHGWFHGQSPCIVNGLKMSSLPDITLQILLSFVLTVRYMQTMGILRWRIVQTPEISVFGCHSESYKWQMSTPTYHLRSVFNKLGSLACNFLVN
jgi:hypothetical protein